MAINKNRAIFRYGVTAPELGVVLGNGASKPTTELVSGLTWVNTANNTLEWYSSGGWHTATNDSITWLDGFTSNISAIPSSGYGVDTAGGPLTVVLSPSPNAGDVVYIYDLYSTWGTNNCLINSNGQYIDGAVNATYPLDRAGDFVTLTFTTIAGWKVAHSATAEMTNVEKMSNHIQVASTYTALANTVNLLRLSTYTSTVVNLPANPGEGDECWFYDAQGAGHTHSATIGRNGKTIGGYEYNRYIQSSRGLIGVSFRNGDWIIIHDNTSNRHQALGGINLDQYQARRPGHFWLTTVAGTLPPGVSSIGPVLLSVEQEGTYHPTKLGTNCKQTIEDVNSGLTWVRYYNNSAYTVWRKDQHGLTSEISSAATLVVKANTVNGIEGGTQITKARYLPTGSAVAVDDEVVIYITGLPLDTAVLVDGDGGTINGKTRDYVLSGSGASATFRYVAQGKWVVVSDNMVGLGGRVYTNIDIATSNEVRYTGTYEINNASATGFFPPQIAAVNKCLLYVEQESEFNDTTPKDVSVQYHKLIDLLNNRVWRNKLVSSTYIGPWKTSGNVNTLITDSSPANTIIYCSGEGNYINASASTARTVTLSGTWDEGATLLISNSSNTVISIASSYDVIAYDGTNAGKSNTMDGIGEISLLVSNGQLKILAKQKRA